MKTQGDITQFDYGKIEYQIAFLPFVMLGLSIPLIAVNLIVTLIRIVNGSFPLENWTHIPLLIISFIFILLGTFSVINQHNKIRVTSNGLLVRVFSLRFYKWVEVPWESILDIKLAKRADRWGNPLWLIEVSRLTLWHKVLGYVFHTGNHPVILLSSDMKNREYLMNIIEEHTERMSHLLKTSN